MNKNMALKLIFVLSVLLVVLILIIYFGENEKAAPASENNKIPVMKNIVAPVVVNKAEEIFMQNETKDDLNEMVSDADIKEESKFKQYCLDILNEATNNMDVDNILPDNQANIAGIFNDCIYEIERELALTEKQFIRSPETMTCLNSVYEIRDYLLDLGTNAQLFSELPNNNTADGVKITEEFIRISDDIIVNGGAAMMNRSVLCSLDKSNK